MRRDIPEGFKAPGFRPRRVQNWLVIGLLYSFFYMTRYNLAAIAPSLMEFFGWTKVDYGWFESVLPLVYGLSVVINGPIADKIGGRKAFLLGAAGVTISSGLFGAVSFLAQPAVWDKTGPTPVLVTPAILSFGLTKGQLLAVMVGLWAINGYCQSFGALSIVKINAQWFHKLERGTFSAVFGVLIRLGLVLAFSGVPTIVAFLPWQWGFWIPGSVVGLLFFATFFLVRDTPAEAGFGELDTGDEEGDPTEKVRISAVLRKVFTTKVMWMIAVSSMMIGVVRRSGIDGWFRTYFDHYHHIGGTSFAYQLASWGIALSGIAGGFTFGILSDKEFGGRRAPVVAIGFIGMVICLGMFYMSDLFVLGPVMAALLLSAQSFFVNGAHGIIGGAASMDFGGRKAAGTATGLFDGMQYLAASFVGVTVGWITSQPGGWHWWKLWPIPFAIAGAVIMSFLWNVTPAKRAALARQAQAGR